MLPATHARKQQTGYTTNHVQVEVEPLTEPPPEADPPVEPPPLAEPPPDADPPVEPPPDAEPPVEAPPLTDWFPALALPEADPEPLAEPDPLAEPEPLALPEAEPEPLAEPDALAELDALAEALAEAEPVALPVADALVSNLKPSSKPGLLLAVLGHKQNGGNRENSGQFLAQAALETMFSPNKDIR